MAKILIKVDVRQSAALLSVLRTQEPLRQALGEQSFSFCVNDDARHIGIIVLDWTSFNAARQFADSTDLQEQIKGWPVKSVLEVCALRDIENELSA